MIATMVISLPSERVGGDVSLSLNDEKQTLRSDHAGKFGSKYLAWYADVNHTVKPVVLGHRLFLTYNLIRQGSAPYISRPLSVQFRPGEESWASNIRMDVDIPD